MNWKSNFGQVIRILIGFATLAGFCTIFYFWGLNDQNYEKDKRIDFIDQELATQALLIDSLQTSNKLLLRAIRDTSRVYSELIQVSDSLIQYLEIEIADREDRIISLNEDIDNIRDNGEVNSRIQRDRIERLERERDVLRNERDFARDSLKVYEKKLITAVIDNENKLDSIEKANNKRIENITLGHGFFMRGIDVELQGDTKGVFKTRKKRNNAYRAALDLYRKARDLGYPRAQRRIDQVLSKLSQ